MCPGGWKVLVEYYDSLDQAENGGVSEPVPAWMHHHWVSELQHVWVEKSTIFSPACVWRSIIIIVRHGIGWGKSSPSCKLWG